MYQGILKDDERLRQKALQKLSPDPTLNPQTYSTPLNTPSSPVQQPSAVIDPECQTCVLSPPPELVEAQSREERAKERMGRLAEYEAQKGLARSLEREQGVNEGRQV